MSKLGRFSFIFLLIFIAMHGYRLFLIVTSMGDEPNYLSKWDGIMNFFFGFPMVLINSRYPFYLGSYDYTSIEFLLISILNTGVQAMLIFGLIYYAKKLKQKFR